MFVFLQGPTFELCRHGHNEGGFRRDVGAHFRSKMLIHRPSFQHFSWNSLCVVGFPPLLSPGPPSDLFFRAGCRAPTHRFAQLGDHYGGSLFFIAPSSTPFLVYISWTLQQVPAFHGFSAGAPFVRLFPFYSSHQVFCWDLHKSPDCCPFRKARHIVSEM